MTKNYPHLSEMGVTNPQQIEKYAVNSISNTDALRIFYERPKGSILAISRTYKFPRVQRTANAANGEAKVTMESNPSFRAALDELQDILKAKDNNLDVAGAILAELRLLEEDIALRNECIKRLVGKINTG